MGDEEYRVAQRAFFGFALGLLKDRRCYMRDESLAGSRRANASMPLGHSILNSMTPETQLRRASITLSGIY